jgi:hypothetical protein
VVGGSQSGKKVEVYSPDGMCQHNLAPLPVSLNEPVPAYIDNDIFVCGGIGNKNCYLYQTHNDSWSIVTAAKFTHDEQPGGIFNGKIYIKDDTNPEVFDTVSRTWSNWKAPLNKTGTGSCLIVWKDTFILLGGMSYQRGVQAFNLSSNSWKVLDSSSAPMDLFYSGCILLPTDEILVVGSHNTFKSSAALYNIHSNIWKTLPATSNPRDATALVTLGKQVFAIDGHSGNIVEEFDYAKKTWRPVAPKLITHRGGHHGVISLPVELFQHLPGGCAGVQ